jgi:succinate dehydrogenase/fumarate reductase flavoprotein subunit
MRFLIADRRALVKYGLGMVRPGGGRLGRFLRDGYLLQAPTLADLAGLLGIDAETLQTTVARMNEFARTGVDDEFQRGTTTYQRNLGDPAIGNRTPRWAIREAPFYDAIRLYPGDIAASTGLVTNAKRTGPARR